MFQIGVVDVPTLQLLSVLVAAAPKDESQQKHTSWFVLETLPAIASQYFQPFQSFSLSAFQHLMLFPPQTSPPIP